MRKHVLPLGLAAILLSPFHFTWAQAQPASVLTLEQAQELAASKSFAVTAAQREVDANDGAVRQAGAWRNPELNASIEDTQRATRTTTATVDFPIELGGKRAARLSAADRGRELAQAELSNVRAGLRADVVRAFFGVLVAQERVAFTTSSADLAARGADAISKRVAAGKVSPVDETRARVDQANAQLEAAEAAAELQSARQTLAALWGDREPQFSAVQGHIELMPSRGPASELSKELDAAPGLLMSRIEVDRRRALADVERSKGVPDLTVSVGAKRDNDLGRTQAIVGISIPLPLFDRNQGATYEALKRAEKASDDYQAARIRVMTELQHASNQLSVASTSARTLKSTVLPAAQQAYDAAIQYKTPRDRAWRNLMVCAVNAALEQKLFTLRPGNDRFDDDMRSGHLFDFTLPNGLHARGSVATAGFDELAVHAAVNPKGQAVRSHGAGFTAGDAFGTTWAERRLGPWLQTTPDGFRCRKPLLAQLAELDVTPHGFGDRGKLIR